LISKQVGLKADSRRLSSPGLTRRSTFFAQGRVAKTMDARVKPAHDDLENPHNLALKPEQDIGRGCSPAAMLLVRSSPSR
jgi:hypothetical protein